MSYSLTGCLQHMCALRSLDVESCDLTDRFLDGNLLSLLKRKKMEDLRIGMNDFSPAAMRSWMEVFDWPTIQTLSLKGIPSERLMNILCSSLQTIEGCELSEIDLSHCHLTDLCVHQLTQIFSSLPRLKKLILKNNNKLGIDALDDLLVCFRLHGIHIEELDLLGCILTRSTIRDNDRCIDSLRSLLAWSKSLQRLCLSFSRQTNDPSWIPSFIEVWKTRQDRETFVRQPTDYQLLLTVSST